MESTHPCVEVQVLYDLEVGQQKKYDIDIQSGSEAVQRKTCGFSLNNGVLQTLI